MAKEIKNSKTSNQLEEAKKWHSKWSKNVMHAFGIFLWVVILGGIFGALYLIRWIFEFLIKKFY